MTHDLLARVPRHVLHIRDVLAKAGKRSWVVGGCVRDLLRGKEPSDWDVCTDALPAELLRIFPRAIPTGIEHGTVTVVLDHQHYEVTTLRGEGAYSDGRRPDAVHFVNDIEHDLARRDFTVNAIAIDSATGALVDPFGGRDDLAARILRAVGRPEERFSEDGLRVLRAARFCATLGFTLDPATKAAIEPTLDTYRKVSPERVRDEWMKAMKADKPSIAFDVMRETGILAVSCPELLEGFGLAQNRHHSYDVWRHGMECMDACPKEPVLRLAGLFHDVGKPRSRAFSDKTQDYTFYDHDRIGAEMVDPICARLRFSNDERARIAHLVRHHLFHYDGWTDAAVRRWIRRVGREHLESLYALNCADLEAKGPDVPGHDPSLGPAPLELLKAHVERVLAEGTALSTRDLTINGHDLMRELGLPPGKLLGVLLGELLEEVTTDPTLNERGRLLERARGLRAAAEGKRPA
ncbi:MAG: HD domain-containing protein [Myxococcales bacterium]|nr:HD domain-containing protein [Myxococcales bacterium]